MKGFPKRLNSKMDYEYIKNYFPKEQWMPYWRALLDERTNWFCVNKLTSAEEGVTDGNHKVVESKGQDDTVEYYQYELQEDPASDFYKLGFTVDEVERALGE